MISPCDHWIIVLALIITKNEIWHHVSSSLIFALTPSPSQPLPRPIRNPIQFMSSSSLFFSIPSLSSSSSSISESDFRNSSWKLAPKILEWKSACERWREPRKRDSERREVWVIGGSFSRWGTSWDDDWVERTFADRLVEFHRAFLFCNGLAGTLAV